MEIPPQTVLPPVPTPRTHLYGLDIWWSLPLAARVTMLELCAHPLNHPLQQETFITLAGVNRRQLERVSSSGRASWEEMHWLGQP